MENNNRDYNKEKLEKLLADFPAAFKNYLCESIDAANNARSEFEWEEIIENRMSKEQYFVEYMLNNGVVFERVGHWICGNDDQDSWTCSECGFPVMSADDLCDPYEADIKYCEKCGTRMVKLKKN